MIQRKYQITLNEAFTRVLNDMMSYIDTHHGKKPDGLAHEEHVKALNKKCLREAIKYISDNLIHFPKTKGMNLYKSTDDLYQQRSMDRTYSGIPSQEPRSQETRPRDSQPNFQLPLQLPGQLTPEQALQAALEQRQRDTPSMNTPSYQPPGTEGGLRGGKISPGSGQQFTTTIMNILLQTPIALQSPDLVPGLINEITRTPHLMDLMGKDLTSFQQQITNPQFLQMMAIRVHDKNNDRMRPLDLTDKPPGTETPMPPDGTMDLERLKREREMVLQGGGGGGGGDGMIGSNPNLMNQYIQPSEQLVNNMFGFSDRYGDE
jgi:hypothetical protein